jgi:hypothetical protein
MLFLLALFFFSLSTSVTALPMNQYDKNVAALRKIFLASFYKVKEPAPIREFGCWTPVPGIVSQRCSFNVTPFEP